VITHNKKTMEAANCLYGVTMQELGISKLVSVKFDGEDASRRVERAEVELAGATAG
jgi:chromosome segregation protein